MKKLIFAVMLVTMSVFIAGFATASPEVQVPKYSLERIEPETIYLMVKGNSIVPLHNPKLIPMAKDWGMQIITKKVYKIDTDGDGIKNLWHNEISIPGIEYQGNKIPGYTQIDLYIGVSSRLGEETMERVLVDRMDEKGDLGADGKFEKEIIFGSRKTIPKNGI